MPARIRVNGQWLHHLFPTSDLEWSSVWRTDQPSGDYEASVKIYCRRNFEAEFTLPERKVQIVSPAGGLLYGGLSVEPNRVDDGIVLNFLGFGGKLAWYDAVENLAGPGDPPEWAATFVPNDAVDAAVARGAPFDRYGIDLGSDSLAVADDEPIIDLLTLLTRAAIAQGKRVHVDSIGAITFEADPTSPAYYTSNRAAVMGTADDQFLTRLWMNYNESGIGPGIVMAEDLDAEWKYGEREGKIDGRTLGDITEATAQAYVDGRLKLLGGRMALTDPINLDNVDLWAANGVPITPMWLRAGRILRIPGVVDARTNVTTRASFDPVLSEIRIRDDRYRPTAVGAPLGFSPRDYAGALAAPENPLEKETA